MDVAKTESSADHEVLRALGEAVMTRRIQLNVTQEGLCKESGVAKSLIARLESGLLDVDMNTLWKVCTALECRISDLFEMAQSS